MASKIQAINAYRPKVKLGRRAGMDDVVEFIARSTGMNESGVRQALLELRDTVLFFNRRGQAVKLEGLGTYSPSVGLDGVFEVGHRADNALRYRASPRPFDLAQDRPRRLFAYRQRPWWGKQGGGRLCKCRRWDTLIGDDGHAAPSQQAHESGAAGTGRRNQIARRRNQIARRGNPIARRAIEHQGRGCGPGTV